MKAIRLGSKIVHTLVRDHMYYPDRLLLDTITTVARCGILLLLYWYVFRLNNGTIHNVAFTVAAWSMFFYFAFSSLRLRDISRMIMQDVRSGNVEVLFSKPISYISYRMWWQVGTGLYQSIVIFIVGSGILFYTVGLPGVMSTYLFIPTFLLVVLLAVVLSLLIYTVVGLLAFWIEDINPIFWVVDKAVMILGGSYLPIALFPNTLYTVALWSPFGASQFISHTVHEAWAGEWMLKVGIQVLWVGVFGVITTLLF